MENKKEKNGTPLNVLLIGNNPIDLSGTLEKIRQIRGRKVMTEIAFDLRSVLERLMNFSPNYILIDDNIGRAELAQTLDVLHHRRKTRNVPITIIKNSNYQEAIQSASSMDFLLKHNFSPEALFRTISNSLKFKRAQHLLSGLHRRRKHRLAL